MDIDRILSIHQSHSLMKIGAINKQMLIAQYAQCEKISALQKEISASNTVLKQILENQLAEIKHREMLKYYKTLAYSLKEAVGYIEKETNIIFKCFLYDFYSKLILGNLHEAKNKLEEIADKEYCSSIEATMMSICKFYNKYLLEYKKSYFSDLLPLRSDCEKSRNESIQKCSELFFERIKLKNDLKSISVISIKKNKNKGCGVKILLILSVIGLLLTIFAAFTDISVLPSIFIIFFLPFFIPFIIIKSKNNKNKSKNNLHIDKIENKKNLYIERIDALEEEALKEKKLNAEIKSKYEQLKNNISLVCPNWEHTMEMIDTLIPKMIDEKKMIISNSELYEAAKCIIKERRASVGVLNNMFKGNWSIRYSKAKLCLSKLTELGIIIDGKLRIKNVGVLDEYWKFMGDFLV